MDKTKGVMTALKGRNGFGSKRGVALLGIVQKLTEKRKKLGESLPEQAKAYGVRGTRPPTAKGPKDGAGGPGMPMMPEKAKMPKMPKEMPKMPILPSQASDKAKTMIEKVWEKRKARTSAGVFK